MGNLGKKRCPVEAIFDQTVEHFRAVDDLVQLGGPFLRGGHFRFDLLPFAFGGVQLALDLNRPIRVPAVVEEEKRAEAAQGDNAELERIAFALSLLGDFLVEKIELQSHR